MCSGKRCLQNGDATPAKSLSAVLTSIAVYVDRALCIGGYYFGASARFSHEALQEYICTVAVMWIAQCALHYRVPAPTLFIIAMRPLQAGV